MQSAAKGWHPDPLGGGGERWWDGEGWTDQTRPAEKQADSEEARPAYGEEALDTAPAAPPDPWAAVPRLREEPAFGPPRESAPPKVAIGGAGRLSERAETEIVETVKRSNRGWVAARRAGAVAAVLALVAGVNYVAATDWRGEAERQRELAALQEQLAALEEQRLSERIADLAGEKAREQDWSRQVESLLVEATIVGDELIQCMEYQAQVYDGFNRRALGQVPADWGQYYRFLDDVAAYCRTAIQGHARVLATIRNLQ